MNIIKDYEAKKAKEIEFYEGKIIEMHKLIQEEAARKREVEEQLFTMREEMRRLELENSKAKED